MPNTPRYRRLREETTYKCVLARDNYYKRVRRTLPSSLNQKRGNGNPRSPHMGRNLLLDLKELTDLPLATPCACAATWSQCCSTGVSQADEKGCEANSC